MKNSTGAVLKFGSAGTRITTGASAHTAIPNAADGNPAKWVRLTAIGAIYFRPTRNTGTITNADAYLPAGDSVILDVQGWSHMGTLQSSAAEVAILTPLDQVS